MSELELRSARSDDDLGAAGGVVQRAYFAIPGYPRDPVYDEEIGDVAGRMDAATVLLALRDGVVVGCATYIAEHDHPHAEHDDPEAATFRAFAVAPEAQGAGVGSMMLEWLSAQAVADGKPRIRIHTLECMTAAKRTYERAGYRRDPERDEDWDGVLGLAYVLDLV
ncbi:MAG: GNAT family N-acetyltransferase [Ilumatobacteraceae bacterium]